MSLLPELPPLPDRQRYLRTVREIDDEFMYNGGTREYLRTYLDGLRPESRAYKDFFKTTNNLGQLVEPVDWSLNRPVDEGMNTHAAFNLGALAGLIVVGEVHDGHVRAANVFSSFTLPSPDADTDAREFKDILATQVVDLGDRGMTTIGDEAENVVETWEHDTIEDGRFGRMFRVGLGLVALYGYRQHEALARERAAIDFEEFKAAVAGIHDYDWDAGARTFGND